MDKFLIIFLVLITAILLIWWTQTKPNNSKKRFVYREKEYRNKKISDLNLTFDRAKKEFTGYLVINKLDKILVYEQGARFESKEVMIIRLDHKLPKSLILKENILQARYPYPPSKEEMRNDFFSRK